MDMRVIVDGDAEKGWIVEIHDGSRCETFFPEAATADEAKDAAMRLFAMMTTTTADVDPATP